MELFASDFDGTLYFPTEGIRPADREAIQRFRARGNLFGLCTGRNPQSLWPLLDAAEPMALDFYILCSGALILDGKKRILESSPLSARCLKAVLELCRIVLSGKYAPVFGGAEGYYKLENSAHFSSATEQTPPLTHTVREEEFANGHHLPVYTVSIDCRTEAAAREAVCALAAHSKETGLAFYQNARFIDTVQIGCSKGEGLRAVCRFLNFSGTPACIGDSYNDLPMLEATPLNFTFHTSPNAVRAKARFQVDSIAQGLHILETLPQGE